MAKQTNPVPAPEGASSLDVTLTFASREDGPERLVSGGGAAVHLDGDPRGLKLVGFSLWRSPEGDLLTSSSKAFGTGQERPSDQRRRCRCGGTQGSYRRRIQGRLGRADHVAPFHLAVDNRSCGRDGGGVSALSSPRHISQTPTPAASGTALARVRRLLLLDEPELHWLSFAKKGAAFSRISFSIRSCRASRRSATSSPRSAVVSAPVPPGPASTLACFTRCRTADSVRSRSRETWPTVPDQPYDLRLSTPG
jgi:hypothetical protein